LLSLAAALVFLFFSKLLIGENHLWRKFYMASVLKDEWTGSSGAGQFVGLMSDKWQAESSAAAGPERC